jgi:UDP-N-acetylglucosamine transferase subunit ALG13
MAHAVNSAWLNLPQPVVIQAGSNADFFAHHEGAEVFSVCQPAEFRHFVEVSSVIIAHAGVGATKTAVLAGKVPAVFARRGALREHVDDHQFEWRELLRERGLIHCVDDEISLMKFLQTGVFSTEDVSVAEKLFDEGALRTKLLQTVREMMV